MSRLTSTGTAMSRCFPIYFGNGNDLVTKYIEDEDRELLHLAMQHLTQGRRIIELRFGLKGGSEKTQKEVADPFKLPVLYFPS